MRPYDKSKYSKLRYKFPGSEKIDKNYSQAYQDMFVLTMLDGKMNGTFLEIGASDAIFLSNTYLLETQFNWRGISVDIDINSKKTFEKKLFKKGRKSHFILHDALTLNYESIFEQQGFGSQIDYLQVDIEPQEQTLQCLKTILLSKRRFSVITFETDYYDPAVTREKSKRNRDESRVLLTSHGYELLVGNIANTGPNDIFEDWYVDPRVVDKKIIDIMKYSEDFNDASEKFMLT